MKRWATLLIAVLLTTSCTGDGDLFEDAGSADSGADYSFTIPAGAGEAIDRGEPLDILPGALQVRIGEVLELVNLDDRGHLVGPFFVGEGETLRQRFSTPGVFEGICSVHPSGEFVLTVVN